MSGHITSCSRNCCSRAPRSVHTFFQAADEDAHVSTLYVDKATFNGAEAPKRISVTIAVQSDS